jgi:hypothetical protein
MQVPELLLFRNLSYCGYRVSGLDDKRTLVLWCRSTSPSSAWKWWKPESMVKFGRKLAECFFLRFLFRKFCFVRRSCC